jgi:hypothetical protein
MHIDGTRTRYGVLRLVLVAAVALTAALTALTAAGPAAAESAYLAGSVFQDNFTPCPGPQPPALSQCASPSPPPTVSATCNKIGDSIMQISRSGNVNGAPWTDTITATIGPQYHRPRSGPPLSFGAPSDSGGFAVGMVKAVSETFTIATASGTVTGRTRLPATPDLNNYGVCRELNNETSDNTFYGAAPTTGFSYILNLGMLEYDATAPAGSQYVDSGVASMYMMNSFMTGPGATGTEVRASAGHFFHAFGTNHPYINVDADIDGVEDAIDDPSPGAAWRDEVASPLVSRGPVNYGIVNSMTEPLSLTVTDLVDPYGVWITLGASTTPDAGAWLSTCGATHNIFIAAGSAVESWCGSYGAAVQTGSATIVVGGGLATIALGEGDAAKVAENADGTFTVSQVQGTVDVTVDGVTTPVTTGSTLIGAAWDFQGFSSPVDNGGVLNTAKAGRAIPLKWHLLNAQGNPVTTLSSATIAVKSLDCSTGTTTDAVEEFAPGGSGLQNLGNGYYQLNWQTPSSYAGSCKTLKLNVGDGVTHDALFKFTR